jgi:ABC-type branched-subunit amino acid transport system substrate-binding protein
VFLGGRLDSGRPEVVRALRDQLGDDVAILAPDGVSLTGIAGADQLGREGRRFAQGFGETLGDQELEPSAVYAAQAMEVVLDAIGRSDGTRSSVLRALFDTRIPNGLIGAVSFDRNGNVDTSPVTIFRVQPGSRTVPDSPDVVVDRVLQVPVDLLR